MGHQYNEPPHNEVLSTMSDIAHPNNAAFKESRCPIAQGLVDFAIRLVNSVLNLKNRKTVKIILLVKKRLGLAEMMSGLVNASFSLPEWQAVKMIFFAPCKVKISGKVPHDCQNLVVAKIFCQLLGRLRALRFYCNKKNCLKIRLFLIKQSLSQEISGVI